MEAQSAVLAMAFGVNYQYGKRKISALSNEEFNALTPEKIEEMQAEHTKVQIEGFIKKIPSTQAMQKHIIDEMVRLEFEKLKVLPKLIAQVPASLSWIFGIPPTEPGQGPPGQFQDPNAPGFDPNLDPGKFNPPDKPPTGEAPPIKKPSPKTPNPFTPIGINPQAPPPKKERRNPNANKIKQLTDFIESGLEQIRILYIGMAQYRDRGWVSVDNSGKIKNYKSNSYKLNYQRMQNHVASLTKSMQQATRELEKLT